MTDTDVASGGDALHADRPAGDGPGTLANALLGGLAAVVLSGLPGSPVLGGLLAGYLEAGAEPRGVDGGTGASGGDGTLAGGARVGALAGLFALVPVVAGIGVALAAPVTLPLSPVALLGVALLGGLAYVVGGSALGGALGSHLRAAT